MDKSQPSASSSSRRPPSELKLLGRQWVLHARLFVSAALGIAVTLALLALPWRMSTRLLVGWDIGVALYLGHLSGKVFKDSLLFPFALSLIGLAIIWVGVLWQRREAELTARLRGFLPSAVRELLEARAVR